MENDSKSVTSAMAGSGSLGPPYTTMRSLASRGTARLWHHPTVAFILVIGTSTLRVSGFHISSVFTSTAHTRQIQRNSLSSSAAVSMSTATLPRGGKPLSELEVVKPKLWIYDHCPFCVRPRMVAGIKGIAHDLAYLSNDDVATPTAMMGKKMVPILELGRPGSDEHEVMSESLDIVRRLDEDPAFGPPALAPASKRTDINDWIASCAMVIRRLTYPRLAQTPLPEFQTKSARETYIRNHPIPDSSSYEENLANSAKLIEEFERELWKLDPMIYSADCVTAPEGEDPKQLSYDDIVFFAKMRSITMVRGLGIPPKLRAYLDAMSERCDIPLYDRFAS